MTQTKDDTFTEKPDPFWLRALLNAHKTGQPVPTIDHGGRHGTSRTQQGMWLAGCKPIEDAAFRLRYLGQVNFKDTVALALLDVARGQPETFRRVHCGDCLSRLVFLVVDEEIVNVHLQSERARADYMGITRSAWRHRYDDAHKHLKSQVDRWTGGAISHICKNLYGED